MNKRSLGIAALAACVMLLGAQPAWALPPDPPLHVYGTVKVNGANVAAGTPITAWCSEVQAGLSQAFLDSGISVYVMDVLEDDPETPTKDGCVLNDTVSFKIGDLPADQTIAWKPAESYPLPLSVGAGVKVYLPLVIK